MKHHAPVGRIERAKNFLVWMQNYIVQRFLAGHIEFVSIDSTRLGTPYGGWWSPKYVFSNPSEWILISCGLGHDISFDRQMNELGIPVLGVDIEQRWIDLIVSSKKPQNLEVIKGRVGKGTDSLDYELLRLEAISKFGNKRSLFLKMDIEGCEMEIFEDIDLLSEEISILAFELDYLSLMPFLSVSTRIKRVLECRKLFRKFSEKGFCIYKVENWNFHLVRS